MALERLRRDESFIAYDDGNDFWWSAVCLLDLDYHVWPELMFQ